MVELEKPSSCYRRGVIGFLGFDESWGLLESLGGMLNFAESMFLNYVAEITV